MVFVRLALLILAAIATGAKANDAEITIETVCMDRADLVARLKLRHGERTVGRGLSRTGYAVEIFVSPKRRTWTFVRTKTDGLSCVIDTGSYWQDVIVSGERS